MDKSICLALIHNNNALRNTYVRSHLVKLLGEIEQFIAVDKIEVSFQSAFRPHSTVVAFTRDIMQWKLDREWCRYRLLKPRALLLAVAWFLKGAFIKYIIQRGGIGELWKKNSAIEMIVTDKHIRAWGEFLDTGADFLICFEDDAVFKDDSSQNINDLLTMLIADYPNTPCYIDIGGGCRLSDLMIDRLEEKHDKSYRYYRKPVTNTACAYLMSRQLVATFYSILTRRPWLRLIGIDWMMNCLFMQMEREGLGCVCMHADPTIVKHGSTTGEYESWQIKEPN